MPRRSIVVFWVLAIGIFVALRAVAWEADAPRVLAHGGIPAEMLVEPPAKASEARNWALFGAFHTHPVDNYQFWRPQSPLWVYPLAATFRIFGTSYATLRMTATAFGVVGLVALALWAHRRWGPSGAIMAAAFVAFDNVAIFWGRSGLLEPIVAAWVALALYFLDRAFDDLRWAVAAILVLAAALAIKLAALPAIPVFAVYGLVLLWRAPGVASPAVARAVVIGVALVVGGLLLLWVMTPEYQRTLMWNFHHMVVGRDGGTAIDLEAIDDHRGSILAHQPTRLRVAFLVFSALLLLGVAEVVALARDVVRRRVGMREALPAVWLLAFAVAVFGATFFAFRFVLLLGPPLVLLSVGFVHRAIGWLKDSGRAELARRAPLAATLIYAVAHLGAWGYAVSRLTWQVRDGSQVLTRRLEGVENPVCIGLWSAPVVLETRCMHFYVKKTFNATPEALRALRPTHLLLMPNLDDTRSTLQRVWPELISGSHPHETFTVRGRDITIFEVPAGIFDAPDAPPAPKKKKRKKSGKGG